MLLKRVSSIGDCWCGILKILLLGDNGATLSRGFGFVQFALKEDAAKAIEQLKTKKLKGRVPRLELALRKHLPDGTGILAICDVYLLKGF